MSRWRGFAWCAVLVAGAPATGFAVEAARRLPSEEIFAVHDGSPPREHRLTSDSAPAAEAAAAWNRFVAAEAGGRWEARWDLDTAVPLRIYGSGRAAPGALDTAESAEAAARAFLAEQIEMLAPGALPDDFELVSNDLFRGVRSVGFLQESNGLRVIGGQLSFRFKADRLVAIASEAFPRVEASPPARAISDEDAREQASRWLREDFGIRDEGVSGVPGVSSVSGVQVLPIVRVDDQGRHLGYSVVRTVRVDSISPRGRWDVYVDAATGAPVARRQLLMFGSGTATLDIPERWPGGARDDFASPFEALTVNGLPVATAGDGSFSWAGSADAAVTATTTGPYVTVVNDAGAAASAGFVVPDQGIFLWSDHAEFVDAQLTAFFSTNRVKEYVRPWNPGLAVLDQSLPVHVNVNDTCNAFASDAELFFFRQGGGCSNTGRLVDVVHHEFGHWLHFHSILPGVGAFEAAMSEGAGDFLAATIVGDAGMGRGFFLTDDPLRDLDPAGSEAVYPEDLSPDPHISGLIYGGAFWDLREALIADLGAVAGVAKTEELFYATLQRASGMTTAYIEVLIEDDDDGNLSNGTPNLCAIDTAFRLHGLAPRAESLLGRHSVNHLNVSIPLVGSPCDFSVSAIELDWRNRAVPSQSGTVAMTLVDGHFVASIPFPVTGEVVQYRFRVTFSDLSEEVLPRNPADPWYEQFAGEVTPISCTDFESDPASAGWTHAQTSGSPGGDDWEWGVPLGTPGNGDPTTAYSGASVLGNDLGTGGSDGRYKADIVNQAESPSIDVSGYSNVRLQYRRWLAVEDGQFDQAKIYGNGILSWQNAATAPGDQAHVDREWRFHDVELTASVLGGAMQVRFELASDGGLEFGGWTLDDFCLVAYDPTAIFSDGFESEDLSAWSGHVGN
jgi:hypothetical protein